jgi:Neuraminidase (sialidase)
MNGEDLLAFRSEDEGLTWSSPTKINAVADRMEIYGALSTDGGKTWQTGRTGLSFARRPCLRMLPSFRCV